ncbi:hypothetical protein [Cellvibrio sp.]|uniref:hypothetical protein n=1 Tax=Cellvibrio sp. TaxID=1965322 RepID=UPI003964855E
MSANFYVISAIALDIFMIVYTLWVLSLNQQGKMPWSIGLGLLLWLVVLHLGLSNQLLFSPQISGVAFLFVIFAGVGLVGALLFSIKPIRTRLLELTQEQLLLFQGIRVFFGAGFLMQAAQGHIPLVFGVIDGWTHITAGFLGLAAAFTVSKNLYGNSRVLFANLFGLADILIVASSIALILLPELTPHHTMMYAVFLPAPLWLWFHLISLWKLNTQARLVAA